MKESGYVGIARRHYRSNPVLNYSQTHSVLIINSSYNIIDHTICNPENILGDFKIGWSLPMKLDGFDFDLAVKKTLTGPKF